PGMAENWDAMDASVTIEQYRDYARLCIRALNHALDGIPQDRVRYHMCWGSWHGPHLTDIPLRDIVDLLLTVRAGALSLESGNVRQATEWKVWRDATRPRPTVLFSIRGSSRTRPTSSSIPSSSPPGSSNTQGWSDARTWLPGLTADLAVAFTRRWRGPSCKRSSRARNSRRANSGPREINAQFPNSNSQALGLSGVGSCAWELGVGSLWVDERQLLQGLGAHLVPSASFLKWVLVTKAWFKYFESDTIVVTANHSSPLGAAKRS